MSFASLQPIQPQTMTISPCTGHEYPFGIKISHIRDAMPHGSKHCACPRQLQGSFLTEQLPQELQCQFVLKPSRLAESPPLHGTSPCLPASFLHSLPTSWLCCGMPTRWDRGGRRRGAGRCWLRLHGNFAV